MSEHDFPGTARFRIERSLGAGGMGVVYCAFDRQTNQYVALKTLNKLNPEHLYHFKREFRSLSELVHPNLVALYELFAEDERWFFTMEFLDGAVGFRQSIFGEPEVISDTATTATATMAEAENLAMGRLQNAGRLPADIPKLRSMFAELAGAINVLHSRQKLHCDLKPSNVMVRATGQVVVLDFGMVKPSGAAVRKTGSATAGGLIFSGGSSTSESGFWGTPAYAAPEQIRGELSTASDWYAFGVMLFEALTLHLPYDRLSQKMDPAFRTPEFCAPRRLNLAVPADLNDLCVRLLSRSPEQRPELPEILAALAGDSAAVPAASRSTESRDFFFGREPQLAALRAAFAASREGQPAIARVHGGSGSGKSVLVDRFLDELATQSGVLILVGRCYEQENVPYKAVDDLMDALALFLHGLPSAVRESLLPEGMAALARLFPVLPVTRGQLTDAAGEASLLRARAVEALRTVLNRICAIERLVLYIDDLQWGDSDSAALLSAVLAQPGAPPLLLVASHREVTTLENPCVRAIQQIAPADAAPFDIAVQPFSPEESEEFAATLLTTVDPRLRQPLAAQSRGNPYLLRELAEQTRAGMELGAGVEALDLDRMLLGKVRNLDADSRFFLELLTVSGRPLALDDALHAVEGGSISSRMLASLRVERLLRAEGGEGRQAFAIYHDRIRESIVSSLAADTLCQRHSSLASALEAGGTAPPEVLALHFNGSGNHAKACGYYESAADRAARALAFDRAEEFFLKARDLASDLYIRARIQEKLIHFYSDQARFREAYATGREALVPFGIRLPASFQPPRFLLDLLVNRLLFLRLKVPELADLPVSADQKFIAGIKLLAASGKAAYQIRAELCIAILVKMVNLCVRRGNTPDCAIGYMAFGAIFLGGVLGRHASGYQFGRLSLDVVEKFQNRKQMAEVNFVVGYFGTSWLRPATEAEALWSKAWDIGIETGDLFHTGCAAAATAMSWWMRGVPLERIETQLAAWKEVLERYGLRESGGALMAVADGVATARSGTPLFSPGSPEEAAYRQEIGAFTSRHFALYYAVIRMQILHFEGRHGEVLERARAAAADLPTCPGMLHAAELRFYEALSSAATGRIGAARRHSRRMSKWAAECPENFLAKERLLTAEIAAAERSHARAAAAYEQAAAAAARFGQWQIAALSHRLWAQFEHRRGRPETARAHAAGSREEYLRWGAASWANIVTAPTGNSANQR